MDNMCVGEVCTDASARGDVKDRRRGREDAKGSVAESRQKVVKGCLGDAG